MLRTGKDIHDLHMMKDTFPLRSDRPDHDPPTPPTNATSRRVRLIHAIIGVTVVLVASAAVSIASVGPAGADPFPLPTSRLPVPTRFSLPATLNPLPTRFPQPPPYQPPAPPPGIGPLKVFVPGDSFSSGEGTGMGHYRVLPPATVDHRHQSGWAPSHIAWVLLEQARRPLNARYIVSTQEIETQWDADQFALLASSGADSEDYYLHAQIDPDTGLPRTPDKQVAGIATDADLVIMGLGGNDAHYSQLFKEALDWLMDGILQDALAPPTSGSVAETFQRMGVAAQVSQLLELMPEVSRRIGLDLEATWEQAPNAQVVVMLYPQGLKSSGNPNIPFFFGSSLDQMYRFGTTLNETIRAAVLQFIANHPTAPAPRIFDPNVAGPGYTNIIAGHELGQQNSYFNGLVVNREELLLGHRLHAAQESFHLNQFGALAMGKALATFLANEFPTWFPTGPNFDGVIADPRAYTTDNFIAEQQLKQWLNTSAQSLCALTGGPACATNAGGVGGDTMPVFPRPDPPVGVGPTDSSWYMNGYMLGIYITGLGESGSGDGDGGSNGNPNGTLGFYVQDPSGQWYWMYTNSSGGVEFILTPPPQDPCNPNPGGGPLQPTRTPCPLHTANP
jgi:hypothetical protein